MDSRTLYVWVDRYDRYDLVGTIVDIDQAPVFQYSRDYNGGPISKSLPLTSRPFTAYETAAFFSALAPEGGVREYFQKLLRAEKDEYARLLERLNDESLGALVFSTSREAPGSTASYRPIDPHLFLEFASNPSLTANSLNGQSRLSLTGAMAKIGLYRSPVDDTWHIPLGAAPSTHIVKAGNDSFPFETVNEAICLETARCCGFDVPDFELVPVPGHQPLFVTRRYDRVFPESPRTISGHPAPMRLHQEDFGQALGIPPSLKYEPTDGHYLEKAIGCTSVCEEPFGEAMLVMQYVLFDYLMGNADDHLKNFAFLYGPDLTTPAVAPMYDVVSTAAYDNVFPEMGVSFGGSRRMGDVSRRGIENAATRVGLPPSLVMNEFDGLVEIIPAALEAAKDRFAALGFHDAEYVADTIRDGFERREKFDGEPVPTLRRQGMTGQS